MKTNVYASIDDELHTEFKKRCAEYKVSMSSVMVGSIMQFMNTHPPKPSKRGGMID